MSAVHEFWCQSNPVHGVLGRVQCNCGAELPMAPFVIPPAHGQWYPIATAPRDGTPINVWLSDADDDEVDFYCVPGTRFAAGWAWARDKFRPLTGLKLTVTVQPNFWMPIPKGPDQ